MRRRTREKKQRNVNIVVVSIWFYAKNVNNITRVPKRYKLHTDRMIFPIVSGRLAYPENLYSPPLHARSTKNAHYSLPSEQLRLELRVQSEWWSNQLGIHTLVSLTLFKLRDTLYCTTNGASTVAPLMLCYPLLTSASSRAVNAVVSAYYQLDPIYKCTRLTNKSADLWISIRLCSCQQNVRF